MNPALVAPLLLALVGLAAAWSLPRFVHPAICVRVLVGALGIAAAAILAALVQIVVASAGEVPGLGRWVAWCSVVYPDDHGASAAAGAVALAVLAVGLVRALRRRQALNREVESWSSAGSIQVLPSPRAVAFAVPGEPGSVVVSSSLFEQLDREGRAVVLAHERAHLDDRHHRYLRFAELCSAAFPVLVPVTHRLRFATERWADERAAEVVGSRSAVARAVARVGLLSLDGSAPSMGFAGGSTTARVEAMLAPPPNRTSMAPLVASGAVLLGVLLGSSVQLHHLGELLAHLCGA